MNVSYVLGVVLACIGALLMNLGKGVQKQHVHVFLEGRQIFAQDHRRTLAFWGVGLAMTASAALPYNLGLKYASSPSTISAMTGIGLVGLAVYATRIIGEKLSAGDVVGIALVLLGTTWMSFLGSTAETAIPVFDTYGLIKVNAGLILTTAIASMSALVIRRIHGLAFGVTAGLLIGLSIFMADAGLVRAGGSFFGQFQHAFVYVAILYAGLGLVATQFGFIRARALEVVPSINAAIILTPLLLEWAIYGQPMEVSKAMPVLVIVVGVVLLSTGASSAVWESHTDREP